jgi:two-component sensor histidine kinase
MKDRDDKRAEEILGVIMSFAKLDFSKKCKVHEDESSLDGIAGGVNMLGEELKASTISLQEKENLVREIHHRVKNNMQIISSMLRLQSHVLKDEKLNQVFEDCQSRITAMALIHEMLYMGSNFKFTNLESYLKKLCHHINISYRPKNSKIDYDIEVEKGIFLDLDTIIPLGLILNECVSNIYKHAFQDGIGHYYVKINKSNNSVRVKIGDNGKGIDDSPKKNGLGNQLIEVLVEQLDGSITLSSENGLHYDLVFDQAKL